MVNKLLDECLSRFVYSEEIQGILTKRTGQFRGKIGNRPGYLRPDKRRILSILRQRLFEHDIVWLMHKGYLANQLDHIDRNPLNNSINNLREVTLSQNCMNRDLQSNNTSGYKGVSFRKDLKTKPWVAHIKFNGKQISLGYYPTAKLAAEAYDKEALKLFGDYARLNFND